MIYTSQVGSWPPRITDIILSALLVGTQVLSGIGSETSLRHALATADTYCLALLVGTGNYSVSKKIVQS